MCQISVYPPLCESLKNFNIETLAYLNNMKCKQCTTKLIGRYKQIGKCATCTKGSVPKIGQQRKYLTNTVTFQQGMKLNGMELSYVETTPSGTIIGSFIAKKGKSYYQYDDKFAFIIASDENGKYLQGEDLYVPKEARGKGLAKAMVRAQEEYARGKGITRAVRTPGNKNGAVFWTLQGYDWKDEVPIPIQGDLNVRCSNNNKRSSIQPETSTRRNEV